MEAPNAGRRGFHSGDSLLHLPGAPAHDDSGLGRLVSKIGHGGQEPATYRRRCPVQSGQLPNLVGPRDEPAGLDVGDSGAVMYRVGSLPRGPTGLLLCAGHEASSRASPAHQEKRACWPTPPGPGGDSPG